MLFLSVKEAINLLEPMTNDPVNYVRQGALISSALIMIQQSEVTCPKVGTAAISGLANSSYAAICESSFIHLFCMCSFW